MLEGRYGNTAIFSRAGASRRKAGQTSSRDVERLAASAILILGAPRSGTTWLAKIIDSHPDVLYRHEPDELNRAADRPTPAAQVCVWISEHGLRAAAKRPYFPKSWRPEPLRLVRQGLALALAAGQRSKPTAMLSRDIGLPDLVMPGRRHRVRAAIKLVNWDGRRAVSTMPDCRCCLIVRHPCGQVASVMAGHATGRFGSSASEAMSNGAAFAAARGVGETAFRSLPPAAQLAWCWLAFNEPAVEALQGRHNARVVLYEDLCRHPETITRDLFAFAGLDWNRQSATFLAQSTDSDRADGYYGVHRISSLVADRWRRDMPRKDQDAVRAVVRASPLRRFWPDLAADAVHPGAG
jgi:hypothetical protein